MRTAETAGGFYLVEYEEITERGVFGRARRLGRTAAAQLARGELARCVVAAHPKKAVPARSRTRDAAPTQARERRALCSAATARTASARRRWGDVAALLGVVGTTKHAQEESSSRTSRAAGRRPTCAFFITKGARGVVSIGEAAENGADSARARGVQGVPFVVRPSAVTTRPRPTRSRLLEVSTMQAPTTGGGGGSSLGSGSGSSSRSKSPRRRRRSVPAQEVRADAERGLAASFARLASMHKRQRYFRRPCSHTLLPPHCMHRLRMFRALQIPLPPHATHRERWRP